MSPRPYRMSRRGESAEETRRRIVRATYELHQRNGIAATSMRDIAERADVAIGTVYHHFPTYEQAIEACGAYTAALTRPPGPEALAKAAGAAARLEAVVEAVFGFYRRFPGYERVRAERDKFAGIERFMRADEDNRRTLLAAALKPRRLSARALAVALAILDNAFYRALLAAGLSHQAAVDEAAALLQRQLIESTAPVRVKPSKEQA